MTEKPKHSPLGASGAERRIYLTILVGSDGTLWTIDNRPISTRSDKDGYLIADIRVENQRKTIRVHRAVAEVFIGRINFQDMEVDHINRDRTDNRIENLRYVSISQNRRNVGVKRTSASGIRNVRWKKDRKKWQAYCHKDGKFQHFAYCASAEEARAIAERFYDAI